MNIPMNIPIFFGPIWFFKVATSEAVATCQGLRWVEKLRSVALDDYFDFNGIYPQKINFNKPTLWYLWCFHGINYICIYIYICRRFYVALSIKSRKNWHMMLGWFRGLYYPLYLGAQITIPMGNPFRTPEPLRCPADCFLGIQPLEKCQLYINETNYKIGDNWRSLEIIDDNWW